jgi:hypothetical protein
MTFAILSSGMNYPLNDVAIAILSAYNNMKIDMPDFSKKMLSTDERKKPTGTYKNIKTGMEVTISQSEGKLTAQAKGQPAFPLETVSDTQYKFEPANVLIEFNKDKNGDILSFLLKQNGAELLFEK